MTTAAFKGSQTLFQLGTSASPPVYTTMGEVTTIGPLGAKSDLIEVTHMLSTAREYISGLPDGVEFTVTMNYIPTNAQQVDAIAAVAVGTARHFKYTMPSGGGSLSATFDALILGWNIPSTAPNEAVHLELSLKVTGAVSAFA